MPLYRPMTRGIQECIPKLLWTLLRPQLNLVGSYGRTNDCNTSPFNLLLLPAAVQTAVLELFLHTSWPRVQVYEFKGEFLVFGSKGGDSSRRQLMYPKEISGELAEEVLRGAQDIANGSGLALFRRYRGLAALFTPLAAIMAFPLAFRMLSTPAGSVELVTAFYVLGGLMLCLSVYAVVHPFLWTFIHRRTLLCALHRYNTQLPPDPPLDLDGPVRVF